MVLAEYYEEESKKDGLTGGWRN